MSGCKFEVGKKYRFRSIVGWARFVMFVPEAASHQRCVFVSNGGIIRARFEDRSDDATGESPFDVLPEEYTERLFLRLGRGVVGMVLLGTSLGLLRITFIRW